MVLVSILAANQQPSLERSVISHARIVSGCDTVCSDASSLIHQVVKLHVVVAKNAWARCFTLQIAVNERTNNRILEILLQIQDIEGNSKMRGHTPCIPEIVQRTASAVVFPELHGKADDFLVLPL